MKSGYNSKIYNTPCAPRDYRPSDNSDDDDDDDDNGWMATAESGWMLLVFIFQEIIINIKPRDFSPRAFL